VAMARRQWLDSRFYLQLHRFSSMVLLSALWMIVSLPVVTVFPATVAIFGVVREWNLDREPPLLSAFWRFFRENLRHALALEAICLVAVLGAVASLRIAAVLPSSATVAVQAVVFLAGSALVAGLVYAFPIMVSYRLPLSRLLSSSVLFALGRPMTTLGSLAVVGAAAVLSYAFPLAPLFVAGLVASTVYGWCSRAFTNVRVTETVVAA
jgi:uncharacterized membrane protein YesL